MNMKKITPMIGLVLTVALLTGCGGEKKSNDETAAIRIALQ